MTLLTAFVTTLLGLEMRKLGNTAYEVNRHCPVMETDSIRSCITMHRSAFACGVCGSALSPRFSTMTR